MLWLVPYPAVVWQILDLHNMCVCMCILVTVKNLRFDNKWNFLSSWVFIPVAQRRHFSMKVGTVLWFVCRNEPAGRPSHKSHHTDIDGGLSSLFCCCVTDKTRGTRYWTWRRNGIIKCRASSAGSFPTSSSHQKDPCWNPGIVMHVLLLLETFILTLNSDRNLVTEL